MTNVIKASELTQEIVATLPEQVTDYKHAARLKTTWNLRDEEPCEGSILRKSAGDKVAVFLDNFQKTIIAGTIKKVNKTTVRVEYTLPNTGEVREITINEDGSLRGAVKIAYADTLVTNYLEGHFEQMVELEIYKKTRTLETNVARKDAGEAMKKALSRLNRMSKEEAEAIVALLEK